MKHIIHILFFTLVVLLASCVTYDQTSVLTPLNPQLPVSASSGLRVQQQSITSADYEVISDFQFDTHIRSQFLNKDPIPVDLNDDLEDIKQAYGADAIVDLTIQLKQIKSGGVDWIMTETYIGLAGLAIATNGILGLLSTSIADDSTSFYGGGHSLATGALIGGSIIAGAGFGGAIVHRNIGHFTYVYEITGTAVRLH